VNNASPLVFGLSQTSPLGPPYYPVTVVASSISNLDFGFIGTASLGDTVYLDSNGDGDQDVGEPGLGGVTVRLTTPIGTVLTATTDAAGHYNFTGLGSGSFFVEVITTSLPTGTTQTEDPDATSDSRTWVNLSVGEVNTTTDFGYLPPGSATIGDTV
jgi:large repetitive protein